MKNTTNVFESFKTIYEAFLGADSNGVEFFKNPKSIKRMGPNIRGIINTNGDVYIADVDYYIHRGISQVLNKTFRQSIPENIYTSLDKFVAIQRIENLDVFYLGESYNHRIINDKKVMDNITEICKLAKQKNPYLTFVIKRITEANLATDFNNEKII